MSNIKTRIEKLEEHQPCICMIAVRFSDGPSLDWNRNTYSDWPELSDALEKLGLQDERFIIMPHYGNRP